MGGGRGFAAMHKINFEWPKISARKSRKNLYKTIDSVFSCIMEISSGIVMELYSGNYLWGISNSPRNF